MVTLKDGVEQYGQKFVPYNGKIADITHADVLKHFLALDTALSETRKIVAVILYAVAVGAGVLRLYPNEGTKYLTLTDDDVQTGRFIVIADGTQRLQYSLSIAGGDFDLFCLGYSVET